MSGNKIGVIDSNIVIYVSKGILSPKHVFGRYTTIYASIITYIETLGYDFDNRSEEATVVGVLEVIPIINLNLEIAERAIAYRKQHRIKLPDALILATARQLEADLITNNPKDFRGVDQQVHIVVPDLHKPDDNA